MYERMSAVHAAYLTLAAAFACTLSLSTTASDWIQSAPHTRVAEKLTAGFRPPSVPLVVVDPYLSVWSMTDHLYDDYTRNWVGNIVCLSGMISIDGTPYRFMSKDPALAQYSMQQINVTVYPTQTEYIFHQDGVQLVLKFSTPSIAPYLYYYPVTFITYNVSTIDGKSHYVQLYYDNTAEGTVSETSEKVVWNRVTVPGHVTMRIGTEAQDYLGQKTDRINWGYWYVDVENDSSVSTSIANSSAAREAFVKGNPLPPDDQNQPRACDDGWPVLAVAWNIGAVQPGKVLSKYLTIAYDQVYSIRYFGTAMIPLWKNDVSSMEALLSLLQKDTLQFLMDNFDDQATNMLYMKGGSNYSTISSLAWRQATGGTVAVYNGVKKEPWLFMKEISSDGDVSTVDVMYPASPLFLLINFDTASPMKLLLLPVLDYANNQTFHYGLDIPYNLSWAPHHLGRWPICDILPKNQEQMPMEETANMFIIMAYIVKFEKDLFFLDPYWPLLEIWGKYLSASLPDPGDQLCTDDFEGPSPHNVNLAAKGIVGLASYAYMLRVKGDTNASDYYDGLNKNFVQYWIQHANDGDHYRLQYNISNSWSLKYNLFFQKVMSFDLFPDFVFKMEEEYYQSKMNAYGIPLDDRKDYTKTDWQMWVAAMGTQEQFRSTVDHIYKFANETPDRVPFTDWYYSSTGRLTGFRARPVIGGLLARMLLETE